MADTEQINEKARIYVIEKYGLRKDLPEWEIKRDEDLKKDFYSYIDGAAEVTKQLEQAKEECEQLQEKWLSESYDKAKFVSKVENAKEIIKTFCDLYSVFNSTNGSLDNFIAKAEQFLQQFEKSK